MQVHLSLSLPPTPLFSRSLHPYFPLTSAGHAHAAKLDLANSQPATSANHKPCPRTGGRMGSATPLSTAVSGKALSVACERRAQRMDGTTQLSAIKARMSRTSLSDRHREWTNTPEDDDLEAELGVADSLLHILDKGRPVCRVDGPARSRHIDLVDETVDQSAPIKIRRKFSTVVVRYARTVQRCA